MDQSSFDTPWKGQNQTAEAGRMIAQSVAGVLADHLRLTVEGIDRMYLNVYIETAEGVFQVRQDELAPRVGAGLNRTP